MNARKSLEPVALYRPGEFSFRLTFSEAKKTVQDLAIMVDGEKALDATHAVKGDGTGSFNLLVNSEFVDGSIMPWRLKLRDGKGSHVKLNFSSELTLKNAGTAYVYLSTEQQSGVIEYTGAGDAENKLPVVPGNRYRFFGYFGTHRCASHLSVLFFDRSGRLLERRETSIPQDFCGGDTIAKYCRVDLVATAPVGASDAAVRLSVETIPGAKDAFLFFTRIWFGQALEIGLPEWSPSLHDIFGVVAPLELPNAAFVEIPLPLDCLDGNPHTIEVHDRSTGAELRGSPITFQATPADSGDIVEIADGQVVGTISFGPSGGSSREVELLVDGQVAGSMTVDGAEGTKTSRHSISLEFCDGRPHVFALRLRDTRQVLARMPGVSPRSITPFDSLQLYAGLPIDASLSPLARSRYRAVLDNLAAGQRSLRELHAFHERLLLGPIKREEYPKIQFPRVDDPLVSIIVPVHNKFEMTYVGLCALALAYNEASYEVIVVDDGSTDETAEIENIVEGVSIVRHETASGFVRACNDGARKARGQYVVFLNNDTEPATRWLDEMLYIFRTFNGVGLVGSKLLYPDGSLQEAGGIVWDNGNPWNYGRKANPVEPSYSYTRQVDYLSGAAIMLPRATWEELGGFSDEFAPAYFEDTDLAFKVRDLGLKTVFAPLSVVYHYEGVSSGTSVTSGMKQFQEVNRPKFKRKWSSAYRNNGREGIDIGLEKDRGIRLRALMIDFEAPRADFDAGSYAAIQEIRALQALGFKVTFLPTNYAYLGRHTELLQRMGVETLYAPFSNSIDSVLAKRGREFDLVYVTRYQVAQEIIEGVRRFAPAAKVLLNLADLHFLRELRAGVQRADQGALKEALRTREAELATLRLADLVLSYSGIEEAVILSHNLDSTKTARLPWICESKTKTPPFGDRKNIGFLGGFRHYPNVEAVDFFVEQVMPLLGTEMPGVVLEIYGSAISPENIKKWTRDNVVVRGWVDSVDEAFDAMRVFVAPLLTGAGVKGKLFDCLSHGVPSVISPCALEGVNLRDKVETFIAVTPDQWVTHIKSLYTNEMQWQQMSSAAKSFIDTLHSFPQGVELMRLALEKVGLFCAPDPSYLVANRCRP